MKKIVYIKLFSICMVLLVPLQMMPQIMRTCNLSDLTWHYADTVINSVNYRKYSADELTNTNIPESPQLPKKILRFSVPYNATNISLSILYVKSSTSTPVSFKILPVSLDLLISDSIIAQYSQDSIIYQTNAFYPPNVAEISDDGYYMGDNHIVSLAIYPMQYNPYTNRIKRNTIVQYRLNYDLADNPPENMITRNSDELRQQGRNETKALVENPNQVDGFAPDAQALAQIQSRFIPENWQTVVSDSLIYYGGVANAVDVSPCEYMIVTSTENVHSYRRLAALKRQKGYSVGICAIEKILNDPLVQCGDSIGNSVYPIQNEAGKLRQYLRRHFNLNKTRYVLFGDNEVPHIKGYNQNLYGEFRTVPSDMYFSNLTTNWNKDNDDYYGENNEYYSQNNYFDFYPQLYVGRLMVAESQQISNYTDKLLRYELNPGKGLPNYVGKSLIVHGADFTILRDSAQYVYNSVFESQEVLNQWRNGSNYWPSGEYVINKLDNDSYGFLSLQGHGNPAQISVNSWNDYSYRKIATLDSVDSEQNNGLDCMSNKYKPFVLYSLACYTIPFDKIAHSNSSLFYLRQINIGQSFTLGKDYGGIAFLGNTRAGLKRSSSNLETCFAKSLNISTKIGVAEAMSKVYNIENYGYIESAIEENHPLYVNMAHNLMGDPEVNLWTASPVSYCDITVNRTNNSITINGTTEGDTIAYSNNTTQGRIVATGNSTTLSNISPNSVIMVYKQNYIPYIAPIELQNLHLTKSQYVIVPKFIAGSNIDSNRQGGDVVIKKNVNYEVECSGSSVLSPGFKIEKGARFSIKHGDF